MTAQKLMNCWVYSMRNTGTYLSNSCQAVISPKSSARSKPMCFRIFQLNLWKNSSQWKSKIFSASCEIWTFPTPFSAAIQTLISPITRCLGSRRKSTLWRRKYRLRKLWLPNCSKWKLLLNHSKMWTPSQRHYSSYLCSIWTELRRKYGNEKWWTSLQTLSLSGKSNLTLTNLSTFWWARWKHKIKNNSSRASLPILKWSKSFPTSLKFKMHPQILTSRRNVIVSARVSKVAEERTYTNGFCKSPPRNSTRKYTLHITLTQWKRLLLKPKLATISIPTTLLQHALTHLASKWDHDALRMVVVALNT